MSDPLQSRARPGPSQSLVAAALAGLMSVGPSACGDGGAEPLQASAGSHVAAKPRVDASAPATPADAAPDADAAGDAPTPGDAATDSDGAVAVECDAGPGPGVVTSSKVDPSMTLEKFTADCAALGGKLEIHPHCGGANSCKGISYDTGSQVLTEHTCKGANTCGGFSCVVC